MRLIDADALKIDYGFTWSDITPTHDELYELINRQPTIDAVPVVHGEWINVNEGRWNTIAVYKCSICGEFDSRLYGNENYCLNCGAKMDGGADNGM